MKSQLILALLAPINALLLPRQSAQTITHDYEDYDGFAPATVPSVNRVSTFINKLYEDLVYDRWVIFENLRTGTLDQNGDAGLVGSNFSSIAVAYPEDLPEGVSETGIASFTPKTVSLSLFVGLGTGVSSPVSGTVIVYAYDIDGVELPDAARFVYNAAVNAGQLKEFTFPASWSVGVTRLEFEITDTSFLIGLITSLVRGLKEFFGLTNTVGGSLGTIGSIGFIWDDFKFVQNCEEGFKNDAESGECECLTC